MWSIPLLRGCPRGLMVKATDYEIVVSDFEIQSRYEARLDFEVAYYDFVVRRFNHSLSDKYPWERYDL